VIEAANLAGAKEVYLVTEPLLRRSAAGWILPRPAAAWWWILAAVQTDIAVISLGGEVTAQSLRVGGIHMEEAISRHIKRVYNLAIGDRTAEDIKISIASAYPTPISA